MTVKEIRSLTGLSQNAFASRYHIPPDTLRGWESAPGTARHRNCPPYVLYLLELVVKRDFSDNRKRNSRQNNKNNDRKDG